MKWKTIFKYFAVIFGVASVAMVYLANRDMIRIYGGLTNTVDTAQFDPYTGPITVSNVNILSPDGKQFIPGQSVVIDNGIIVSIDTQANNTGKMRTINGAGKYLIPGLTDSHVHLFRRPNDLLLYVANGVTQIREMIGEKDHLIWRKEIKDGRIGPEMFIASPRIGSFEPLEGFFMSWSQWFINITNATNAEVEVNKFHQQGYDAVKIYSQINKETYQAVAKTAKSLGMKVVGHVPWSVGMEEVYSNQNEIAHLEELMNAMNREFGGFKADVADKFLLFVEKRSEKIARELLTHDIAVTTTLWLVESFIRQKFELLTVLKNVELEYENPGITEWTNMAPQGGLGWLPGVNRYQVLKEETETQKASRRKYWETYAAACRIILKNLINTGVRVMAGTDANLPPTVPGFSLHDELISLNRAGMTPAEVLMSATAHPAEWLGNNAGEILPGKKANLVLLDKNPLGDISNTKAINSVIVNGQLLDRALLDKILAAVKEANDSSRTQDISAYVN